MNAPLAAFVLKCPECGAPQPGPQATCRYCKVPLMWAPARSLSRDDGRDFEVEDEPNTLLRTMGPMAVNGCARHTFRIQADQLMRPRFLWVPPAYAPQFSICSVRVGVVELLREPTTALVFARGRGWPISEESLAPGINFCLEVENRTACAQAFEAVLRSRVLPRDWKPPVPTGYRPSLVPGFAGGERFREKDTKGRRR